ncbi:MAG TPA: FAD:protein FMN transferase [Vicinamibacteria bacterium]|nr:FAD:protein FMN transferase [Vicinamibacteria bacterium]
MKPLAGLAVAVAVIAADTRAHGAPAPGPVADRYEFAAAHMGTTARIVLYAMGRSEAEAAAQAAFARIGELDARLSDYRADSEVSLLGQGAGGPAVALSHDLLAVLARAQEIARRSDGAFDVTVGPLSRLWRRARRLAELPSSEDLQAALALVGHDALSLDTAARSARLERPGMRLDLGGIAKGYAADEALRTLRGHGFERALVTLGGEVVAGSPPPGRDGWTVAVATPGAARAPLSLREAAASTSGDAEQWVEIGGRRYSHIFDPRTGRALEGRRSVTVVAREGILADALATALSVLGPAHGRAVVESFPGAEALWVEGGEVVTASAGWSALPRVLEAAHVTP